MGKFFENLNGVLIAGLVLAILIALLPDSGYANSVGANNLWLGIFQWLHVFFGITWIGLLYYFNFVQIPTMPTRPGGAEAGRQQIYRAQGAVLLPLGRGLHRPDRPDRRLSLR